MRRARWEVRRGGVGAPNFELRTRHGSWPRGRTSTVGPGQRGVKSPATRQASSKFQVPASGNQTGRNPAEMVESINTHGHVACPARARTAAARHEYLVSDGTG